ncbi:3-methyl-2-oxobutanoate hydroxymethyltransferase, partial [Francisella tularensis]|uniref:3-methyl-2-oxobutanoate hydroxymethyltransferase n=1 Tax=Francisella tularensis TaxID=263 RepID=UPI001F2B0A19
MKSVLGFKKAKVTQEKISMVTCYDYTLAKIINSTDIDCILVGDSGGMVLLGKNKDSEIQNFVDRHLTNKSKRLIIHFSGLLDIKNAYSAHPLQSFPDKNLYSLDEYKSIAFVTCDRSIAFSELLPKLPNANFCIDKSQKA